MTDTHTPEALIEALIGHLTTSQGADVEWGIADRDYVLSWDKDVAGPAIEATIYGYDDTDWSDGPRQVATVRVTFEVTS